MLAQVFELIKGFEPLFNAYKAIVFPIKLNQLIKVTYKDIGLNHL